MRSTGSWGAAPPAAPWWFKAWFAFCALVGLAALGALGWLLFAAVSWLNRH